MLKKTITWTDYDGNERTDDYYFYISKPELIEWQASEVGGLDKKIERISREQDVKKVIELMKEMIQLSYGVKSDDGKRFIKNQEVLDEFMQTEAYSELFMELATDADAAADFINGILPAGLAEEVKKIEAANAKKLEAVESSK